MDPNGTESFRPRIVSDLKSLSIRDYRRDKYGNPIDPSKRQHISFYKKVEVNEGSCSNKCLVENWKDVNHRLSAANDLSKF
jgi:hypothetical protein